MSVEVFFFHHSFQPISEEDIKILIERHGHIVGSVTESEIFFQSFFIWHLTSYFRCILREKDFLIEQILDNPDDEIVHSIGEDFITFKLKFLIQIWGVKLLSWLESLHSTSPTQVIYEDDKLGLSSSSYYLT